MTIHTKLFGEIEVRDEEIIRFPDGLLGFDEAKEFVLVDAEELKPLTWLVSTRDPALIFPLAEPQYFTERYELKLRKEERALLQVDSVGDVAAYVIVTLPNETRPLSANLRGPLLINVHTRTGVQLVLSDDRYPLHQPALALGAGVSAE